MSRFGINDFSGFGTNARVGLRGGTLLGMVMISVFHVTSSFSQTFVMLGYKDPTASVETASPMETVSPTETMIASGGYFTRGWALGKMLSLSGWNV
ncbi:MAG TPA: hypothetical protein VHY08_09670 [Bacillota bacterium]|nr:hypothetical protein [Bacillota bacterium]